MLLETCGSSQHLCLEGLEGPAVLSWVVEPLSLLLPVTGVFPQGGGKTAWPAQQDLLSGAQALGGLALASSKALGPALAGAVHQRLGVRLVPGRVLWGPASGWANRGRYQGRTVPSSPTSAGMALTALGQVCMQSWVLLVRPGGLAGGEGY